MSTASSPSAMPLACDRAIEPVFHRRYSDAPAQVVEMPIVGLR